MAGSLSIETLLMWAWPLLLAKSFWEKNKRSSIHTSIHPCIGGSVCLSVCPSDVWYLCISLFQCTHPLPVSILPTTEVVGLSEVLGSQTLRVMATKAPQMLCRSFFCWKGRSLWFGSPSPPQKKQTNILIKRWLRKPWGYVLSGYVGVYLHKHGSRRWVPPRGFLGR